MSFLRKLLVGVAFKTEGEGRLKDLDSKVNGLTGRLDKLGKTMDKVGKWGMTRITLPLLAMGGVMTNTASWAEEMTSKFNVVFGEMADVTEQWAAMQAREIGRSKLDLMDYLSESQNMLVGMGMARDAATEMSKQITQMGIDLASFNNLAESDAISSLQSALIGNHMAARSLGAVLNENTLALAMQDMGLKGTFQKLDENRKMQVRFRAIVMQSDDAIGDAVRTSDSFANQMRALKGEVKDLSAELGQELLPFANELVGVFRSGVEWLRELSPETKDLVINISSLIALAFPIMLVGGWLWKLGKVVWSIASFIGKLLMPALGLLGTAGFSTIALLALNALLVFEDLIRFIKTGESVFLDFAKAGSEGFVLLWESLNTIGEALWQVEKDVWAAFGLIGQGMVDGVTGALKLLDDLVKGFINIPGRIKEGLSGLGPMLKDSFSNALDMVRNLLPFSPVKDLTSPLADLHKAGRNIIGNIRDGMADAAANVNFHTPVGMAVAPATAGGGSYSFSPHVEINVQGGGSPRETAQLTKAEIERMFPRLMDDFFRRAGRKG